MKSNLNGCFFYALMCRRNVLANITQNKTATKTATSKKETLESRYYQGFRKIKVIRIGFEPMTLSLKG
jgi:hypothetical protein